MGKGRKYCDRFVSTSLKTELAKAYGSVKLRQRGRLSRDKLSSIEAVQTIKKVVESYQTEANFPVDLYAVF